MEKTRRKTFVRFNESEVVLSNSTVFALNFSPEISREDVSLVVDIYDLDNPVHPEGHLGWWQFSTTELSVQVSADLEMVGDKVIRVSLEGMQSHNFWVNEDVSAYKRLVLNAVLRSNVTNAIVYLDKIPVLKTLDDAVRLRSSISRDWQHPKFNYLSYVFPKSSTVRVISRNIFFHDAVGNLCLDLYRLLKQNNVSVEMYAENTDYSLNDIIKKIELIDEDTLSKDQILYFFSTYDPNLAKIIDLNCAQKIAYFHGITDPRKLQTFDPELSSICEKGKAQLGQLQLFDSVATNSTANSRVLIDSFKPEHSEDSTKSLLNNADIDTDSLSDEPVVEIVAAADMTDEVSVLEQMMVHVVPPKLISPDALSAEELDYQIDKPARLLYVGRIKSHKKVEHVLELFAEYLKLDAAAECWIVGGGADKAYWDYLMWVEKNQLKLEPGKVHWLGNVDNERLQQLYCSASAYISMSEDEGFCLPILEAMLSGLPVFVYGLPAIREVIQDSGLYFDEKDFVYLAQVLHTLLANKQRCLDVIERQRQSVMPMVEKMDGREFLRLLQPSSV
ncbi:MAG: glycosyltransferase [Cyanobacteria bacterium P01_D01_bin.156]